VYPRWSFILSYGGDSWLREQTQNILPDYTKQGLTELQQISSLFLACKGAYGEFYYDDPEDDSRLSAYLGQYSYFGSQTYPILVSWGYGPTNPSLTYPVGGINVITNVYVNGSVIPTANWALDSTRTQLYITGVANSGQVRADFTFYYRCRFLDDTLAFSQFAQNLWETKEVRFESVKP
jgi:hypothetical protein